MKTYYADIARHALPGMAIVAGIVPTGAAVRLPGILSDGMVVQYDKPLRLWGTAEPGEKISVRVSKGKKAETVADASGEWQVELPPLKKEGCYTLTVNDKIIRDVVPGIVLLCSGQSNMELPVRRVTDMFADEVASYSNPDVRQFKVCQDVDFHTRRTDCGGTWTGVTPATSMDFSALGYFTAKELNARTGMPVGIVNAAWGGTPIESWISEEYMEEYPELVAKKKIYEDDGYRERVKKLEGENYYRWNSTVDSKDPGLNGNRKWYDPALDDSSWSKTVIPGGDEPWATDGLNPVNGTHWFRRHFTLDDNMGGKPGVVRMGCIVDADSVYLNGTFIGTTGYQYPPRIYNVPAGLTRKGDNVLTVRLISQNGRGHFVPEKPYCLIAGDDKTSLSGEWLYRRGIRMPAGPAMMFWHYEPAVLYNAMISPLVRYPFGGVVWYQGESNVGNRNKYAGLLETMIRNWRTEMHDPALPFYIVELADFLHKDDTAGRRAWAEMRREQRLAAENTENAWIVENADLGEWNDIHPLDKKTLGRRVADKILK